MPLFSMQLLTGLFVLFSLSALALAETTSPVVTAKESKPANKLKLQLSPQVSSEFDAATIAKTKKTDLDAGYRDVKKKLKNTKPSQVNIKDLNAAQAVSDAESSNAAAQSLIDNKVITNSLFEIANSTHLKPKKISIEAVRAQALENNLSLKVISQAPEIAGSFVREERAKFDSVIYANASVTNLDEDFISGDTVKFSSFDPVLKDARVKLTKEATETRYVQGELGVAIPLQTGAKVKVGTAFKNKKIDNDFPTNNYNSALKFSISQPLLRNAGLSVNNASIKIAQLNQDAVSVQSQLQSIRVIATLDKAYWALYRAWLNLAVRQQQYDYASQNFDMVSRRVEEGLSARIELNRANIGVADRVNALIIAKTQLKIAERNVQFFLNDLNSATDQEAFLPTTQPSLTGFSFDRESLIEKGLAQRLELLEQELKLTADVTKIDYLRNQTLPLFTLDYSYGALSNTSGRLSDAYSTVNDGFDEWSIGFNVEIPLTNEARRSQLSRAVAERMQRLSTRELQTLTVKREIMDALDYVEQDWTRIAASRKQVIIAGTNYEAELKQFNEGLRTMTEVIESLTQLGESQLREIQAVTDYQVSLIDLAYATGTLFGYSNVEVANK